MKYVLIIALFLIAIAGHSQTVLTTEGQTFTNSDKTWLGVDIPRTVPTIFTFKNNTIISQNTQGYMLQAGDEAEAATNNMLQGAVITGNTLRWSGTDMESITHGIFTGHNINVVIKYNYVDHAPMGIIRKSSNNMSNTSGGVAYNIVRGGGVAIVVKGMSNVNIFNNTLYCDRTPAQTWRPLVNIYTNTDFGVSSVAHGNKIFNNIFYTKYKTVAISIDDTESLTGFQSDYNLFWSEAGSPIFRINGVTMTFDQWKAKGYDTHSVIINPKFKDFVSFVPSERLDYGTDLGPDWVEGLSVDAVWGTVDPAKASQNGNWQVGAMIYANGPNNYPHFVSAAVGNDTPDIIRINFSSALGNVIPPVSAFNVTVNSVSRTVLSVSVVDSTVTLQLQEPISKDEIVTLNYTKPAENALQTPTGQYVPNLNARNVINNIGSSATAEPEIRIYPNPAKDYFNVLNVQAPHLSSVVRLYDLSGKLCLEYALNSNVVQRVPVNLNPGVYILHLETGSGTKHKQKLIIIN